MGRERDRQTARAAAGALNSVRHRFCSCGPRCLSAWLPVSLPVSFSSHSLSLSPSPTSFTVRLAFVSGSVKSPAARMMRWTRTKGDRPSLRAAACGRAPLEAFWKRRSRISGAARRLPERGRGGPRARQAPSALPTPRSSFSPAASGDWDITLLLPASHRSPLPTRRQSVQRTA